MPTSRTRGSFHRRWLPLPGIAPLLLAATVATAAGVFTDPDENVPGASAPELSAWSAYGVSSRNSSVAVDSRAARIVLAPNDHATLSRNAVPGPSPSAVLCTFNVTCAGGPGASAQVFRFGSNFGLSNTDEGDANTYAKLGLNPVSNGAAFRLRDIASGKAAAAYTGTQAITWALNNSGATMRYAAPNGTTETLANDRMDVWVGRDKVFDELVVTTPGGATSDLKWYWGTGSGTTTIDRLAIRPLDETSSLTAPTGAAAAASPAPVGEAGALELYRPSPNPFERTTRFAYAISGRSELVDIGVFDVSGRRIRTLVHGTQSAGHYETLWNGASDDGSRARNGIYFLRASVGATNKVARVVYLVR